MVGNKLHDRNCTIIRQMSDPYNVGWEGVFIPPTLLQHSKNSPLVLMKVKSLHRGCLVISLGRTVRIGHSYSSHMLQDAWWPSTGAFNELRDALPLSFVTSLSTVASRRFWASSSGAGPWRVPWTFGDREQSSSLFLPTRSRKKNDPLWLAKVATFDEPSGYTTFARGRSPTDKSRLIW